MLLSGTSSRRRRPLLLRCTLALLLAALAGCGPSRRTPPPPPAAAAELEQASNWAQGLRARQAESLAPDELVALGYLERLRLGMGSPFRLMDYALQDPRLPPRTRTRVAGALLHATAEGRSYAVDPMALAPAGVDAAGRTRQAALRHLALVEAAVASADDARVGELAVRAAYGVALAEKAVGPTAPTLAAEAAALVRDRVLARGDARMLLEESGRTGRHPLVLVREWRAARRLQVEAPTGAERPPYLDVLASARALPLARAVRAAAAPQEVAFAPSPAFEEPFLSPAAARRLSALVRRQAPPPSAPIRITLDRYRPALLATGDGDGAMPRLLRSGASEEGFVAELARLPKGARTHHLAVMQVEAAVALRAYAQEAVWHPGFPAPSTADLKRAYGLKAVEFDGDVPPHWRPYYRRLLDHALADLESVLPGLDVQGLTIRFGSTGREGAAVAIHDPYNRAIHLPPGTGPGSIAHEVAHDVDWALGVRRYRTRGSYATDLALRRDAADRFAAAVRALPLAPVPNMLGGAEQRRRYEARPAETFARLFDGYATAMLAARGRSNGYLSSLQDDVLTGHGTALAPDARGAAVDAFLPLLMEAAPLAPGQDATFRARWSRRTPGPLALAAEVAGGAGDAGPDEPHATGLGLLDRSQLGPHVRARIAQVQGRREQALRTRAALVCANPFLSPVHDGEAAVRALLNAAADARIRGILLGWSRARGITENPEVLKRAWVDTAAPGEEADPDAPWFAAPGGGGLARFAGCGTDGGAAP
ncbi:hypothetical protein [Longimicrobium sp.]|uniref:hypothetical protein n=1 Tax=Longimicrobium sp. TaxID=2029185 RepID=UPI003B3B0390